MSGPAPIGVVLLLIAWAVWGVVAWPPLKRALAAGDRAALIREYRQTIVGELLLAGLAIGAAVWAGLAIWSAPDELAMGSAVGVGQLPLHVLAGVGAALVGALIGIVVARRSSKAPQLSGDIAALIPATGVERRWFAAAASAWASARSCSTADSWVRGCPIWD